jgi:hypothetical protein
LRLCIDVFDEVASLDSDPYTGGVCGDIDAARGESAESLRTRLRRFRNR